MQAFKRCAYPFKKKLHPFNALTKTFKRFADPFKKNCICFMYLWKRLNGLLIRLML